MEKNTVNFNESSFFVLQHRSFLKAEDLKNKIRSRQEALGKIQQLEHSLRQHVMKEEFVEANTIQTESKYFLIKKVAWGWKTLLSLFFIYLLSLTFFSSHRNPKRTKTRSNSRAESL